MPVFLDKTREMQGAVNMRLTCISKKIREDFNKSMANITKVWLNSTVILNQKRQTDVFFL